MKIKIYRPETYKTSLWSGGTTTELYISPKTANYQNLDFDIRLSSAKVEVEHSTFTILPKIHRQLMILEGEIELIHNQEHSKSLKAFDIVEFEGDYNTTSKGTCTDFNVMTRAGLNSELASLHLKKDDIHSINLTKSKTFIYLYKGVIELSMFNSKYSLNEKELIIIERNLITIIEIKATKNSSLVLVTV